MTTLILDSLPPETKIGALLRFLIETGGLKREAVGKITIRGRRASIQIPDQGTARIIRALDGAAFNNQPLRVWLENAQAQPTEAGLPDNHFERLRHLLHLESKAEEAQTLARRQQLTGPAAEKTGETLLDLIISDEYGGLGGRILVTLRKRTDNRPLPWHRLEVGNPVLLSEEKGPEEAAWRGVVSQRDRYTIQVALNRWLETDTDRPTFRLDVAGDEIARQRQETALSQVRYAQGDRLATLRQVLLGERGPTFNKPVPFTPLDTSLNPTQQTAVRLALSAQDVGLIHGPPGTGKTTTVIELIRQAVQRGETVLACAPSNMAVDNLFERLLAAQVPVVRLGHPARVLPELREHTLDILVDNHPDVRTARKLRREAHQLRDKARSHWRTKPAPGEKRAMRDEAKSMLDDARRLENHAVQQVLNQANVVCATLTGLDSEVLGKRCFDLAVIDEASQCTEPAAWIPLLRAEKVILAGDHYQLPPTIISREAEKAGLGVSLMERLIAEVGGEDTPLATMLTIQYRMHHQIMTFSSQEFYDDALQAAPDVAHHLLYEILEVIDNDLTRTAIHFTDTAGASYDEFAEVDGASRYNIQEAQWVKEKVDQLLAANVSPEAIGVITPYAAQVRFLREQWSDEVVEINSVDGFQGREKEVIIISLVRSNPEGEIGFLGDTRRMNVALTRARRKLILIGDSATITTDPFYQRLVAYFESIGGYHSIWEEM